MREMLCQSPGCVHAARLAPRIHLPPKGGNGMATAIPVFVGFVLCHHHAAVMKVGDVLNDEARVMLQEKAEGVVIDFDCAWLTTVRMYTHDFEDFLDAMARS